MNATATEVSQSCKYRKPRPTFRRESDRSRAVIGVVKSSQL